MNSWLRQSKGFLFINFFAIKHSRICWVFLSKNCSPAEKNQPPSSQQPPSKNWVPVKPPPSTFWRFGRRFNLPAEPPGVGVHTMDTPHRACDLRVLQLYWYWYQFSTFSFQAFYLINYIYQTPATSTFHVLLRIIYHNFHSQMPLFLPKVICNCFLLLCYDHYVGFKISEPHNNIFSSSYFLLFLLIT